MRLPSRPIGLLSAAGLLALASLGAMVSPASAATVPVAFDCQARPPIGAPQQLTLATSVEANAPAAVAAGTAFEVSVAPDPMTVPSEVSGYTVNKLTNLALKFPVPEGSTFQSATLTGGSNIGRGTPTVSRSGNVVTMKIPGPVAGGSTFQLPVLHVTLVASGQPGTTIDTRVAGSSYDDAGLTFTTNVKVAFFSVDVPTRCFANPSPTFT